MRRFSVILCAVVLVFGTAGIARALPYLDINGDHSLPVFMSGVLNPDETWIFDLDNDSLAVGDINPGDTILNATLLIVVTDFLDPADDRKWKMEYADLSFDSINIYDNVEVDTALGTWDVMAYVTSDHVLEVTIDDVRGNFTVANMSVGGFYDAAPVPEPATMLLLGTGLVGVGLFGRKKLFKKS